MAARAGFEPATSALTARRSTTELPSINMGGIFFTLIFNELKNWAILSPA